MAYCDVCGAEENENDLITMCVPCANEDINNALDYIKELATVGAAMLKQMKRAEQLATIAWDWNLGSNGQVEVDGEWVDVYDLVKDFRAVIAQATGEGRGLGE